MPSARPDVSFIVAVRNGETTIESSVRSCLRQEGATIEVIVADDHSNDATWQILTQISSEDARCHPIRLTEGVGRGAARNIAVAASSGNFLAIQDADDTSLPSRLVHTLQLFDLHDDLVVASGQARFIAPVLGNWRLRAYPTDDAEIRAGLLEGDMTVCHPSALIRAQAFRQIGGYLGHLVRAQDLNLMRRLLPLGSFAGTSKDVVAYRHGVHLPYRQWRESSLYSRAALRADETVIPLPMLHAARYPLALTRRYYRFITSRSQ